MDYAKIFMDVANFKRQILMDRFTAGLCTKEYVDNKLTELENNVNEGLNNVLDITIAVKKPESNDKEV